MMEQSWNRVAVLFITLAYVGCGGAAPNPNPGVSDGGGPPVLDCPAGSDGTVCRPSAGPCDVAEVCAQGACPADSFVMASANTECRASAGSCDVAEECDGTSAQCPANTFEIAGTECRASAGVCDEAETCDGSTAQCPADAMKAVGTECRASAGVCDEAELCDGGSAQCPADAKKNASTVCRASAGDCDVVEYCSGTEDTCPSDTVASASTTCGNYLCSGAATACPTSCSATIGQCAPGFACASTCKAAKRVFLTSTTYNGNLGGISGANQKCQDRATAAGLSGTYKAWLSTFSPAYSPAADPGFLHHTGPYVTTTRVTVATSWTDLVDGTLATPISITELGTAGDTNFPSAWSSCNSNGTNYTAVAARDCSNWTTGTGGGQYANLGYTGSWTYDSSAWSLNSDLQCNSLLRLYCFEQ